MKSRLDAYLESRSDQAVGVAVVFGASSLFLTVGLVVELGLGGFLIGLGASGLVATIGSVLEGRG